MIALLNGVLCRVHLGLHVQTGTSSLFRDTYQSGKSKAWPSTTPGFARWPRVEKIAYFYGPVDLVESVYAVAWDSDRTKYEMDAVFVGRPFPTFEIKETRVTQSGIILQANPPVGKPPQIRWNLLGIFVNPMVYAVGAWVIIGLVPIEIAILGRRERYRKWAKEALCPVCGYDIQDLPICPECGTPSHKEKPTAGCPDSLS